MTPESTGSGGVNVLVIAAAGLLLIVGGIVALIWSMRPTPEKPPITGDRGEVKQRQATAMPRVPFTDITEKAGIRFRHTNGLGKKLLPETMGSGVAFLDYNNDGKPDILFVNSCYWPGQEQGQAQPTLA